MTPAPHGDRDSLATIIHPYGVASKVANGLVQAPCERFGLRGLPGNVIFRKFATSAGRQAFRLEWRRV
jgi:hypothetical protein